MKIGFITYGCKVNQYETELIKQKLASPGISISDDPDLYIINTCTVTGKIDKEILRKVKQLKLKKNKKILLTGCLTKRRDISFLTQYADWVVDNDKKMLVSAYPFMAGKGCEEDVLKSFGKKNKAFIKIEDGCSRFCSYCTVPLVRGDKIRSRSEEEIVREAELLSAAGYREIVLTGVNLGLYGAETRKKNALFSLLKKLVDKNTGARMRLSSIGPKELSRETIDFIADNKEKICPHFHLSLQSGDIAVLKAMNRNYSADYYRRKTEYIFRAIPEAGITTDVICGFPGEGEKEFKNTCDFIKEIKFARLHVFPYSDRPGTKASGFKNKVEDSVKKKRVKELISLGKKMQVDFMLENKGKTRTVLVESGVKEGCSSGYTENYIRVNLKNSEKYINKLVDVKIDKIRGDKVFGVVL